MHPQSHTKIATKTIEPVLEGESYEIFINGIKSPKTKKVYQHSLLRYMKYLNLEHPDQLLSSNDTRTIQTRIVNYIMSLRKRGLSYATIHFSIAPLFTFYQLNYVTLNRRIVSRYMGEYKKVVKDRPYTLQEIQKMLAAADPRTRAMIYLLSSTGCRIGGIVDLTLGNLTKIPEVGVYKITFYEDTADGYYSFLHA